MRFMLNGSAWAYPGDRLSQASGASAYERFWHSLNWTSWEASSGGDHRLSPETERHFDV